VCQGGQTERRDGQRNDRGDAERGGGEGAPLSPRGQRNWGEQREMRLAAEQCQQTSGDARARIDQQRDRAYQRRGGHSVLPEADGPENRRIGQHRQAPGPAARGQNSLRDTKRESEGRRLEQHERHQVRQQRERRAQPQIDWRIEKERAFDAGRRGVHLRRVMCCLIVGEHRGAGQRELASGVEAGEVGGRGRIDRPEGSVGPGDRESHCAQLEKQQKAAPADDPVAVEPGCAG
jgi:hypothetical protein